MTAMSMLMLVKSMMSVTRKNRTKKRYYLFRNKPRRRWRHKDRMWHPIRCHHYPWRSSMIALRATNLLSLWGLGDLQSIHLSRLRLLARKGINFNNRSRIRVVSKMRQAVTRQCWIHKTASTCLRPSASRSQPSTSQWTPWKVPKESLQAPRTTISTTPRCPWKKHNRKTTWVLKTFLTRHQTKNWTWGQPRVFITLSNKSKIKREIIGRPQGVVPEAQLIWAMCSSPRIVARSWNENEE